MSEIPLKTMTDNLNLSISLTRLFSRAASHPPVGGVAASDPGVLGPVGSIADH